MRGYYRNIATISGMARAARQLMIIDSTFHTFLPE